VLISMIKWNSFSPEVKAIFTQAAAESIAWQRKLAKDSDDDYWKQIAATGKMKVTEVDRAPFKAATAKVIEQFADSVGRSNLAAIEALRKK
ncbi:MAG: hypothetical protein Q8M76_09125, partial [Spirochaetaceae bacterium]|nr:hypothetical protein [Spirochaetaceae bacterium]